jgi:hypothetical protein
MPAIELVSHRFWLAVLRRRGHSPASVPESSREQAHLSAEQPSACPYPRVPASHAHPRRASDRVRPPSQGSSRALCLRAGSVVVVAPCFPRVPASGRLPITPVSLVADVVCVAVRSSSTAFPQARRQARARDLWSAGRSAARSCATPSDVASASRRDCACHLCRPGLCCSSVPCRTLPTRVRPPSAPRSTARCASSVAAGSRPRRRWVPAAPEPSARPRGSRTVDNVTASDPAVRGVAVDGRTVVDGAAVEPGRPVVVLALRIAP